MTLLIIRTLVLRKILWRFHQFGGDIHEHIGRPAELPERKVSCKNDDEEHGSKYIYKPTQSIDLIPMLLE
jgi:hypothetical protein